jgi:hypothetical protein
VDPAACRGGRVAPAASHAAAPALADPGSRRRSILNGPGQLSRPGGVRTDSRREQRGGRGVAELSARGDGRRGGRRRVACSGCHSEHVAVQEAMHALMWGRWLGGYTLDYGDAFSGCRGIRGASSVTARAGRSLVDYPAALALSDYVTRYNPAGRYDLGCSHSRGCCAPSRDRQPGQHRPRRVSNDPADLLQGRDVLRRRHRALARAGHGHCRRQQRVTDPGVRRADPRPVDGEPARRRLGRTAPAHRNDGRAL